MQLELADGSMTHPLFPQNALRLQKLIFFGTNFLCKCDQPILKKIVTSKVEFVSIVQNRTECASDSEILLESFSDEEGDKKVESNGTKVKDSPDLKSHHDAAEIRRLLRRKDELERKEKMEQKYNERLQVSNPMKAFTMWCSIADNDQLLRSSSRASRFNDHRGMKIEFVCISVDNGASWC